MSGLHPLIKKVLETKNKEEHLGILTKIFFTIQIGFSVESAVYMI